MYQLGAKQFTLNPINHQNKETASRKASHRKNLRYSKYMYLKHWKTFETTLTAESKYLLAKIALLIHPIVWCKGRTTGPRPRDRGTRDRRPPQSLKVGPGTTLKFKNGTPGPPAHYCKWNTLLQVEHITGTHYWNTLLEHITGTQVEHITASGTHSG